MVDECPPEDEHRPEPGESEPEYRPADDYHPEDEDRPTDDKPELGDHRPEDEDRPEPGELEPEYRPADDKPELGENHPEDEHRPEDDKSEADDHHPEDDKPRVQERASLRRSARDRVVAGVAGGIGSYFGIDPVIVRIGFIVLTFMGGAGPFLYLVGWLALPRETSGSILTDVLAGDSPHRFRSVLAVTLIGIGLLITAVLSGELFDLFVNVWSIAPFLALLLIAAGTALVLWPGPTARSKSTPTRPSTPVAVTPPVPHPATAAPQWGDSSAAAAAATVPAPGAPCESSAKRSRRRPRSTVGPITVAVLLIFAGGAVLLDRLDIFDMEIGAFLAIALALTGAALMVSAFAGRARGLILLGVVLAAPLVFFAGTDALWVSGIGERRVTITDADSLKAEYHHAIGRLVVDLRDFEPVGRAYSTDIRLGVGEVLVYMPDTRDNIQVVGNVDVSSGVISECDYPPSDYNHPPVVFDRARILLEICNTLEYLLAVEYEGEDDFNDVEDYLAAFSASRRSGLSASEEQHPIMHLLPDLLADRAGQASPRDLMNDLLIEARSLAYPVVDNADTAVSSARRITAFVDEEPWGELSVDIEVGVGRIQLVTAQTEQEETSR